MYKKILKTMIVLIIIFLIVLYVLKIFFPEQFIIVIENNVLISIGNFIDKYWLLSELCAIITSFITYWFYLGAVTRKWCLNWKEIICVLLTIGLTHLLYEFDTVVATGIPLVAMVLIPLMSKANLKEVSIVFSVHCLAQLLSTSIRNLPALLTNVNSLISIAMTIECYFWLLLFYLYYNYKKEKI